MKKRAAILIILLAALLCGCAGSGRAASAAGVSDASPSEAATAEPTAAPTAAPTAVPTAEPTPTPTAVPTVTAGSLVLDPETAEADLSGITEEAEAETAIRALTEGAPILRSLRAVELGERVPPYELYRELSEAYPEAEIRLSLTLAGESVGRDAKVLDLHAMDAADTPELLRVLPAIKDFPQYLSVRGTNPPVITYYERHREPEALLKGCVKVMEQVVAAFEAHGPEEGAGSAQ